MSRVRSSVARFIGLLLISSTWLLCRANSDNTQVTYFKNNDDHTLERRSANLLSLENDGAASNLQHLTLEEQYIDHSWHPTKKQMGDNAAKKKRQSQCYTSAPSGNVPHSVNDIVQHIIPQSASPEDREEMHKCVADATAELQSLLNQFRTTCTNIRESFSVGPPEPTCEQPTVMQSAPVLIQTLIENPEHIAHIPKILESSVPTSQMSHSFDKLKGSLSNIYGLLQKMESDSDGDYTDEGKNKKKKKQKKFGRKSKSRNNNLSLNAPENIMVGLPPLSTKAPSNYHSCEHQPNLPNHNNYPQLQHSQYPHEHVNVPGSHQLPHLYSLYSHPAYESSASETTPYTSGPTYVSVLPGTSMPSTYVISPSSPPASAAALAGNGKYRLKYTKSPSAMDESPSTSTYTIAPSASIAYVPISTPVSAYTVAQSVPTIATSKHSTGPSVHGKYTSMPSPASTHGTMPTEYKFAVVRPVSTTYSSVPSKSYMHTPLTSHSYINAQSASTTYTPATKKSPYITVPKETIKMIPTHSIHAPVPNSYVSSPTVQSKAPYAATSTYLTMPPGYVSKSPDSSTYHHLPVSPSSTVFVSEQKSTPCMSTLSETSKCESSTGPGLGSANKLMSSPLESGTGCGCTTSSTYSSSVQQNFEKCGNDNYAPKRIAKRTSTSQFIPCSEISQIINTPARPGLHGMLASPYMDAQVRPSYSLLNEPFGSMGSTYGEGIVASSLPAVCTRPDGQISYVNYPFQNSGPYQGSFPAMAQNGNLNPYSHLPIPNGYNNFVAPFRGQFMQGDMNAFSQNGNMNIGSKFMNNMLQCKTSTLDENNNKSPTSPTSSIFENSINSVSSFLRPRVNDQSPLNTFGLPADNVGKSLNRIDALEKTAESISTLLNTDPNSISQLRILGQTTESVGDALSGISTFVDTNSPNSNTNQKSIEKTAAAVGDALSGISTLMNTNTPNSNPTLKSLGQTAGAVGDALSGFSFKSNKVPDTSPLDSLGETANIVTESLNGITTLLSCNSPEENKPLMSFGDTAEAVGDVITEFSNLLNPNSLNRKSPFDNLEDTVEDTLSGLSLLVNSNLPSDKLPLESLKGTADAVRKALSTFSSNSNSQEQIMDLENLGKTAQSIGEAITGLSSVNSDSSDENDPIEPADVIGEAVAGLATLLDNDLPSGKTALTNLGETVNGISLLLNSNGDTEITNDDLNNSREILKDLSSLFEADFTNENDGLDTWKTVDQITDETSKKTDYSNALPQPPSNDVPPLDMHLSLSLVSTLDNENPDQDTSRISSAPEEPSYADDIPCDDDDDIETPSKTDNTNSLSSLPNNDLPPLGTQLSSGSPVSLSSNENSDQETSSKSSRPDKPFDADDIPCDDDYDLETPPKTDNSNSLPQPPSNAVPSLDVKLSLGSPISPVHSEKTFQDTRQLSSNHPSETPTDALHKESTIQITLSQHREPEKSLDVDVSLESQATPLNSQNPILGTPSKVSSFEEPSDNVDDISHDDIETPSKKDYSNSLSQSPSTDVPLFNIQLSRESPVSPVQNENHIQNTLSATIRSEEQPDVDDIPCDDDDDIKTPAKTDYSNSLSQPPSNDVSPLEIQFSQSPLLPEDETIKNAIHQILSMLSTNSPNGIPSPDIFSDNSDSSDMPETGSIQSTIDTHDFRNTLSDLFEALQGLSTLITSNSGENINPTLSDAEVGNAGSTVLQAINGASKLLSSDSSEAMMPLEQLLNVAATVIDMINEGSSMVPITELEQTVTLERVDKSNADQANNSEDLPRSILSGLVNTAANSLKQIPSMAPAAKCSQPQIQQFPSVMSLITPAIAAPHILTTPMMSSIVPPPSGTFLKIVNTEPYYADPYYNPSSYFKFTSNSPQNVRVYRPVGSEPSDTIFLTLPRDKVNALINIKDVIPGDILSINLSPEMTLVGKNEDNVSPIKFQLVKQIEGEDSQVQGINTWNISTEDCQDNDVKALLRHIQNTFIVH